MGVWIRQEWHEWKQLDERAGPAMRQDQRNAVPVSGALMDEVNVDAVELGAKLIDRVQLALLCAPIKPVGPICKQLFKVIKIRPLVPGNAWCLIRPARVADALPEIKENLFLDPDRERSDVNG